MNKTLLKQISQRLAQAELRIQYLEKAQEKSSQPSFIDIPTENDPLQSAYKLISRGRNLEAMKIVRESLRCHLLEAKKIVDALEAIQKSFKS